MSAHSTWTQERLVELRELWDRGFTISEIGHRLGLSRNAVVGKAHRLELTARPSPIKPKGTKKEIAPAPAVTLPALISVPEPEQMAIAQAQNKYLAPENITGNITAVEEPQEKPTAKVVLFKPLTHPCCWPLGDPRKPGFKFCGRHALTGHPYCQTHFEAAYLPRRKKTDSAA